MIRFVRPLVVCVSLSAFSALSIHSHADPLQDNQQISHECILCQVVVHHERSIDVDESPNPQQFGDDPRHVFAIVTHTQITSRSSRSPPAA